MAGLTYLPNVVTLKLDLEKCNGCKMCVNVCPHAVFVVENLKARITNIDLCMECGACAENCPEDALYVESGVGCAYGVIIGKLTGQEPTCGCDDGGESPACC